MPGQLIPDGVGVVTGSYHGDGGYTTGHLPVLVGPLTLDQMAAMADRTGGIAFYARVPTGTLADVGSQALLAKILDERALAVLESSLAATISSGSYSYSVPGGRIAHVSGEIGQALAAHNYRWSGWAC